MKRSYCIFTLVRNEKRFLPIFLQYYKNFFEPKDIYILDHQSNDGSTENLNDVNVISVYHEEALDCSWMRDTVQLYQKEFLKEYKVVIYVDCDELLYSLADPLNTYLDKFLVSEKQYATCIGYEIIHDIETEKKWDFSCNFLNYRNYWYKANQENDVYNSYNKTLISKIPLEWEVGFHKILNHNVDIDNDLFLLHLHRLDYKTKISRNIQKILNIAISKEAKEKNWSWQNQLFTIEKIEEFFNRDNKHKTLIDPIHKQALLPFLK